jgi:neurofibromin 1
MLKIGDLTPNQSRTLLLVAKVLMNMANGVLFGAKEQFMMPLNEFLVANTPLVKGFLADLAVWI